MLAALRSQGARISSLEDEIKSLKQLAVSQGAFNLVLCQVLIQRGSLSPEDAGIVSVAFKEGGETLTHDQIAEWARTRFSNVIQQAQDGA